MHKSLFVGRVLAWRTALVFGLFSFVCVAVIAATYVTSRYALKKYVEDQLDRIGWDLAFYQLREISQAPQILDGIRRLPDVIEAESLVFLRTRIPPGMRAEAGGKPVVMPWFVILAATDPGLLPQEYRVEGDRTVLALFGTRQAVQFNLDRLQDARSFEFLGRQFQADGGGHDHADEDNAPFRELVRLPISQTVQLDRDALNRYFLEHTGAIAFVPFMGAAINTPYDPALIAMLDALFQGHVQAHGDLDIHAASGDYLPEVDHMARLDRNRLISGWDLRGSLFRVAARVEMARQILPEAAQVYVRSDTLTLLERMDQTAGLVDWVALLLALPVIAMAWVFAANLVHFIFLNERRTIGLMRLRGLSGAIIARVFLVAILFGGLAGGTVGLGAGTVIPLAVYGTGESLWQLLLLQRPLLAMVFLGFGLAIALMVGARLVKTVRRLAPGEAVRRFTDVPGEEATVHFGWLPGLALALGAYKVATWWLGTALGDNMAGLRLVDRLLDFVGVPLLIFGLGVLMASRRTLMASAIRTISAVAGLGRLRNFAIEQGSRRPARLAGTFLVGSLACAIVLAPSVALHSFTDRAVRGVKARIGADAQLLFNTLDAPGQPAARLGPELERLQPALHRVIQEIHSNPQSPAAVGLIKAMVPMYMPGYGYGGVPLYLVEQPEEYLAHVYWEDALGIDRPFSEILRSLADGKVAVSPAVAEFWGVGSGDPILLGADDTGQGVVAEVAGVIVALPGAPQRSVEDRDSFLAALTDYLNYLFAGEAFVVASVDNPAIQGLPALVPQMAALVQSKPGLPALEQLSLPPRGMQLLAEELGRIRQDMFIYLVGENLKIYLVAGLLVALSAVAAIFLVNYWEGRRTFALLRVRGASPKDLIGALSVQLYAPLVWSLVVGSVVGLISGYGIAHRIWDLQRVLTVIQRLPSRAVVTLQDALLVFGMLVLFAGLVIGLGFWTFRRTAREAVVQE